MVLACPRPGAAHVGPGADLRRPFDPGSQRQQTGGPWADISAAGSRQAPLWLRGPPTEARQQWDSQFPRFSPRPRGFAWPAGAPV